ncbi:MAG: rod shape-determining protein MreC [Litorimonas sp.]
MARSTGDSSEGRIGLIFLILLSAGLLLLQRDDALQRRTTPLLADDVQAPVAAWLSLPFRRLEGAIADVEDGRKALEENRVLRDELAELRAENDRLRVMRGRQQRLEALLAVDRTGDIPDRRIAVRAVSDPSSPFVRSLLIGAGLDKGIVSGQPVHSHSGLIGHVVSSGRRSARVLRLDDLNSRVAVKSERSDARAILTGTNRNNPKLSFVADEAGWQPGDRVLTSGDDGVMPAGLPVGTVTGEGGLSVDLDFHDRPIDWVYVMPFASLADPDDVDVDPAHGDTLPDGTDAPATAETDASLTMPRETG